MIVITIDGGEIAIVKVALNFRVRVLLKSAVRYSRLKLKDFTVNVHP